MPDDRAVVRASADRTTPICGRRPAAAAFLIVARRGAGTRGGYSAKLRRDSRSNPLQQGGRGLAFALRLCRLCAQITNSASPFPTATSRTPWAGIRGRAFCLHDAPAQDVAGEDSTGRGYGGSRPARFLALSERRPSAVVGRCGCENAGRNRVIPATGQSTDVPAGRTAN